MDKLPSKELKGSYQRWFNKKKALEEEKNSIQ